jgi:hypothetical protein
MVKPALLAQSRECNMAWKIKGKKKKCKWKEIELAF